MNTRRIGVFIHRNAFFFLSQLKITLLSRPASVASDNAFAYDKNVNYKINYTVTYVHIYAAGW